MLIVLVTDFVLYNEYVASIEEQLIFFKYVIINVFNNNTTKSIKVHMWSKKHLWDRFRLVLMLTVGLNSSSYYYKLLKLKIIIL